MFPFAAAAVRPAPTRSSAEPSPFDGAFELRDAAERVLASVTKALAGMAGPTTTVEGALVGLFSVTVREHLASLRPEQVTAAITCAQPACTLLAVLDPVLVHALVELLAGGTGVEPMPTVPRAATAIDGQYAHLAVTLAAAAIEKEWAEQGFASVRAVRLDGGPSADLIGGRSGTLDVLTFEMGIFGLRGTLTLALPPVALEGFASTAEIVDFPANAPDPAWNAVLRRELGFAPVRVDAMLEASDLALGAIAALQPGQVVAIPPAARGRVALMNDGRTIFRGELGQDDDERYCLRIDDIVADVAQTLSRPRTTSDRRRLDEARVSPMEQSTNAVAAPRGTGAPHLDSIMRIPVSVQVFLGSASMPIADLMKLDQGSVVTLDHSVSDPVDVVVNGRVIARGELIALDDDPSKIGVKLIEIVGNPDVTAA